MAQQALPAGRPVTRKRAFFGLFDADGWGWASAKAAFWFVSIIFILGYIPDRAYYFTVERTLDIGLLAWSPVNLCPPENEDLPCPAPAGASLPFYPSPPELALPEARTDGGAVQLGNRYLYIGGSSAEAASASVFVAPTTGSGNFLPWTAGPDLPEPRSDPAVAFIGGSVYVVGGTGADGAPTRTVFALTPDADGNLPAEWTVVDDLELETPVTAAALVATGDGLVLVGGANTEGPTTAVWKSLLATDGSLGEWKAQAPLNEPNADGVAMLVGDFVWLLGGSNATGPVASVQVGRIGGGEETPAEPSPSAGADAEVVDPNAITAWGQSVDLPEPRTNGVGWTANGVLYHVGGSDGSAPRPELWWTVPGPTAAIDGWKHLVPSDLGEGIEGSAPLVAGTNAFVVGGQTAGGVVAGAARNNLAPQEPFFQVGILGATIPALRIEGEIGQQLGYVNAATVGAVNFIILLLIGWAFAHKEQSRALIRRIRRR